MAIRILDYSNKEPVLRRTVNGSEDASQRADGVVRTLGDGLLNPSLFPPNFSWVWYFTANNIPNSNVNAPMFYEGISTATRLIPRPYAMEVKRWCLSFSATTPGETFTWRIIDLANTTVSFTVPNQLTSRTYISTDSQSFINDRIGGNRFRLECSKSGVLPLNAELWLYCQATFFEEL